VRKCQQRLTWHGACRYPAARLMVIVYGIMLHLWVLVVIMTYTPEMHTALAAGDHDHHPVRPAACPPTRPIVQSPCAQRSLVPNASVYPPFFFWFSPKQLFVARHDVCPRACACSQSEADPSLPPSLSVSFRSTSRAADNDKVPPDEVGKLTFGRNDHH
jgi:hypothetical protein